MEFSGYDPKASIIRLKSEKEVKSMFDFVKKMAPSLDATRKLDLLGVFSNAPEHLCLHPGLEIPFKQFI